MVFLQGCDGVKFEMENDVVASVKFLEPFVEGDLIHAAAAGTVIKVPKVTSRILQMVINYCKHHDDAGDNDDDFDAEFMSVDQDTLHDLIMAAHFLQVDSLVNLTCQTVADMTKGRTTNEIREIFNIENDFTPEEELSARTKLQRHFDWAAKPPL